MSLHSEQHALQATLRALQMPGDVVYKCAILAAVLLLLLTAGL